MTVLVNLNVRNLEELKREHAPKETVPEEDRVSYIKYIEDMHSDLSQPYERDGVYVTHAGEYMIFKIFTENDFVRQPMIGFSGKQSEFEGRKMWRNDLAYGLCDNAEQVIKKYPEIVESEKPYVIILRPFFREYEPAEQGFRYHKWGEYIGTQELRNEYLYDDEHVEYVCAFTIYEIEEEGTK